MLMRMTVRIWMRFLSAALVWLGALLTFQPSSFAEDQNMSVIARASSGPLACEIHKIRAEGSVQLTGVVSSTAAVAGNARFLLTKSGSSGTSNINQGNNFNLAAGAEARVSHVTINLQHDDLATVELTATSNDGIVCHAKATLGIEL